MRSLYSWCLCALAAFAFSALLSLPNSGVAFAQSQAANVEALGVTRVADWKGFEQAHFEIADRKAYIVKPEKALSGNPWIWRARFPGYHAEMDVELLKRGFHVGYVDVAGLFGSPTAMKIGAEFYDRVVTHAKLAARPAMEGVSRGGLFVYNWGKQHPERVACIYCDTPVLDFRSWPGGKGAGIGSQGAWKQCLASYGLTEEAAEDYRNLPVLHGKTIAKAKIPILHIVSENDRVVPPIENTYLLLRRLEELGHNIQIISVAQGTEKSNGHHFTHPDPDRVVQFIAQHAGGEPAVDANSESKSELKSDSAAERLDLLRNAETVVFLGDSITHQGGYVSRFEAWVLSQLRDEAPTIINIGLSSETVSGLSEEGHAGGRFPRPDLAERLDRVLALAKPDVVFSCYGINCGIYQPFDEQRFAAYKEGYKRLKEKVEVAGGKLVVVTPPSFDDARSRKDFSYNAVLDRYSEWLVGQREEGWTVIDLHSTMSAALKQRKQQDPDFTFQPDSVHPNAEGHAFMAGELMRWFGASKEDAPSDSLVKVVDERMRLLRSSYLFTAGHKRPGVQRGLPVAWAKDRARAMDGRIEEELSK